MGRMTQERKKTKEPANRSNEGPEGDNAALKLQPAVNPKSKIRKEAAALLAVIGLLLIIVPLVKTYINTRRNEQIIEQFLREAEAISFSSDESYDEAVVSASAEEPPPSPATPESAPEIELTGETGNEESSSEEDASSSSAPTKKPLMSAEEIRRRMTGVLIIEKINLKMIIMDGVDEETLRVAAGRMPGTGNFDEIGNVVLAGHRSYTFGKYFNRLDELEPGDKIIVRTKSRKLEYEVYKKFIIEPDDLSILEQSDTEKILTLFTCHPVVIANKRLVINARQIN